MYVIWLVIYDCVIYILVFFIILLREIIMYLKLWFVIMYICLYIVMNIYIIEDKKIYVIISMLLDINKWLYGFI